MNLFLSRRIQNGGSLGKVRRIGNVNVLVETRAGAVARILRAVRQSHPSVWGFCNAHTVNSARQCERMRQALGDITFFNDGIGVDIASRLIAGEPFPENLNGTDLIPEVLAALPEATKIFLVGSPPGVAARAAIGLTQSHSNLRIAGTHHGFFLPEEEDSLAERIRDAEPALVLVGMGHPRQELWSTGHANRIGCPLICVGAFLDFSAGRVRRAPDWIRRWRFEWIYRLALEPQRLANRYVVGNVLFLMAIFKQRFEL